MGPAKLNLLTHSEIIRLPQNSVSTFTKAYMRHFFFNFEKLFLILLLFEKSKNRFKQIKMRIYPYKVEKCIKCAPITIPRINRCKNLEKIEIFHFDLYAIETNFNLRKHNPRCSKKKR